MLVHWVWDNKLEWLCIYERKGDVANWKITCSHDEAWRFRQSIWRFRQSIWVIVPWLLTCFQESQVIDRLVMNQDNTTCLVPFAQVRFNGFQGFHVPEGTKYTSKCVRFYWGRWISLTGTLCILSWYKLKCPETSRKHSTCGDCLSFDVVCLGVCFQDVSSISWVQGSVIDATPGWRCFSVISAQVWTESSLVDVWCNFLCNPSFFYESLRPFRALHVEI
jgi:hypothetical protein